MAKLSEPIASAPKRGRPARFAEYERLYASLPKGMTKRPKYVKGIGIFRGNRDDSAWVKIHLPHGGTYRGRTYGANDSIEIKLGRLASWSWQQLETKRSELQGRADRGEPIESQEPVRFEDWATQWLERAKPRLRAYETASIHVNKHLVPAFGALSLDRIGVAQVNAWIAEKLREQAPATVRRELGTLATILNAAVRSGMLDANPCRMADSIRGIAGRQRFLDGIELVRLLAAAEAVADWLPDYILWCLHSGMRRGETKRLTWENIRVLPNGRKVALVRTGKTNQPRIVYCSRTMEEILERQAVRRKEALELQAARKKKNVEQPSAPEAPSDSVVFPIAQMTLRRKWEKVRVQAGLKDVTLHDLRRTHSTHAAAAGVDLRTLADRIGHADLSMLQRHYAALVQTAAADAADTVQRVFDDLTRRRPIAVM
jgi:integrase